MASVFFILVGHWNRQWLPSRLIQLEGQGREQPIAVTMWHICTVTTQPGVQQRDSLKNHGLLIIYATCAAQS